MGVINAIKDFIANHGLRIMIFGISAASAGVLMYAFVYTPRYASTVFPKLAMGLFFLGIASYAVGRIPVGIQQNANRRKARQLVSRREDESFDPPSRPGGGDAGAGAPPDNDGKSGAQ
ncbi:hypothetical protein R80B4_02952 [Fibrobacteres bacterium R8-0-B4]